MIKKYSTKFYSSVDQRANNSTKLILDTLFQFISADQIQNSVDVGCGSGAWIDAILKMTNAKITAYDLPESIQLNEIRFPDFLNSRLILHEVDFENVKSLNNKRFDLGLTLEVLEHLNLPTSLKVLTWMSHNCDVILFSAATPGQGGTGHINEQEHSFWLSRFRENGFEVFDCIRPFIKSTEHVARYYALNVFVLVKKDSLLSQRITESNLKIEKYLVLGDPIDYRNRFEKVQFWILKLLPSPLVTKLSQFLSR